MLPQQEKDDPSSCLNRASSDEPVFVFRAKDRLSTLVVSFWLSLCEQNNMHLDRLEEARSWITRATQWQAQQYLRDSYGGLSVQQPHSQQPPTGTGEAVAAELTYLKAEPVASSIPVSESVARDTSPTIPENAKWE